MTTDRDSSFFDDLKQPETLPELTGQTATPAPARNLADMLGTRPAPLVRAPKQTAQERIEARELAKQEKEEAWARRAGFQQERLLFPMGTQLLDAGKKKYQESRKSFDEMDYATDVVGQLIETVRAEKRSDIETDTDQISFDEGDVIVSGQPYFIDEDALEDLCRMLGMVKASSYLATCPPDLRATNLERWCFEEWANKGLTRDLKLRTRIGQRGPEVYAFVTPGYTPADIDKVAMAMLGSIPAQAKGQVMYDGRKARIRTLFQAPGDWPVRVGSNYKAGVEVLANDVGEGSLYMRAVLWLAVCVNLTTVERGVDVLRQIHKGSFNLGELVEKGYDQALNKISPFVERWLEAEQRAIIDANLHHNDVEPVFAKMVSDRLIPKQIGVTDVEMLKRLRRAYWEHPSPTVQGILNAITQAAHRESWRSAWVQDDLQELAGSLAWQQERVEQLANGAITAAVGQGWKGSSYSRLDIESGAINSAPVFQFNLNTL